MSLTWARYELKRVLLNSFALRLAGATLVRAFNQTQRFNSANEARLDRNQHCYMPAMVSQELLAHCRSKLIETVLALQDVVSWIRIAA